jgi:NAD(P)H dehydrogenase (quinone)
LNILIVYAHHEPSSFTSAMKNLAVEVLQGQGHKVIVSDLYGQGFNPLAQKWDFVTTTGGHYNYMFEQKHAANLDWAFSPDIVAEIEKVKEADVLLLVSPLWWSSVPAILKGWFDRVLAMGVAWDTGKIFENGLLGGKQAMMVVSGASPPQFYSQEGNYRSTITQMLHPINMGTLAFCGYNVHEPYVALSANSASDEQRAQMLKDLRYRLEHLLDSPQYLINF